MFVVVRCFDSESLPASRVWPTALAAIAGVFLFAGLCTPIAAAAAALLELWLAAVASGSSLDHLLAAAISLSLTALGPGAWSVDAHLFGRRRISLSDG